MILGVLTVVILWASAFAGIRVALTGYDPGQMAALRFIIAALVLGIYSLFNRMRLPQVRHLPKIALAGLSGVAVYHLALNTGEQQIPAGAASLLLSTIPIWTAILSYIFLRERFKVWTWVGSLISFVGVGLISVSQVGTFELNRYVLLVLLASFAGSVYQLIQKKMLEDYRPLEFNFYAICFGTLFLIPFSGGMIQAAKVAPLSATLAVVYMGIFPAALAFILWGYFLKQMPASRAVTFLYLVPLFAVLIAWIWLDEKPNAGCIGGGALTLAGVILANTFGRT